MADQKISELTALTGANLADVDAFAVVDTSAVQTKKITYAELKTALDTGTGFVRITGDTMTGNLNFGDSNKVILGGGSDLQIYHDGSDSYIDDAGAGNLWVRTNALRVQKYTGEAIIKGIADGAVELYHDNEIRLATSLGGLNITGVVAASDGSENAPAFTNVGDYNTGMWFPSSDVLAFSTNSTERFRIYSGGSALFAGDFAIGTTGSGSYHQSARNLVISGSGDTGMTIASGASSDGRIFFADGTSGSAVSEGEISYNHADNTMNFVSAGDITIDATGLLIKTIGRIEDNGTRLLLRSTGDASGLRFDGSGYTPFKNGSAANGTVDLGFSSGQFKDLYLSNIAYVGAGVYLAGHPVVGVASFDSGYATRLGSTGSSTLNATQIYAGGVPQATFKNGNVGIGDETPTELLEIAGSSDPTLLIRHNTADNASSGKISFRENAGGTTGVDLRYDGSANNFIIDTSDASNALVIQRTTGNVGFGATSPKRHIHLNGGNETTKIQITNQTTGSSSDGDGFQLGIATDGTAHIEQRENADLVFATNNTERVRIGNTAEIQIGGTSNAGFVDFDGTALQLNTQRNPNTGTFVNTSKAHAGISLVGGNADSHIKFYTKDSNNAAGAERVRIDKSGNVGIATTTPSSFDSGANKLVVGDTSVSSQGITIAADTNSIIYFADGTSGAEAYMGSIIYNHTDNNMTFRTNGFNSAMVIDSNQKVGIGTSSPNNKLDVNGGIVCSPNTDGKDTFELSTNASDEGRLRIKNVDTTTVQIRAGGDSYFNGGNVGIGITSPSRELHVQKASSGATATSGSVLVVEDDDNAELSILGGSSSLLAINFGHSGDADDGMITYNTTSNSEEMGFHVNGSTLSAKIVANGDFYTNDGTVHSLSDARIKTNVADLTDGLAIVKQLKPKTFKYNSKSEFYRESAKDEIKYGFIADEVKTVAAQYTSTGKGKIDGVEVDDLKSLSTTKMIPMLVKAIQEQQEVIESLTARITTLEG